MQRKNTLYPNAFLNYGTKNTSKKLFHGNETSE